MIDTQLFWDTVEKSSRRTEPLVDSRLGQPPLKHLIHQTTNDVIAQEKPPAPSTLGQITSSVFERFSKYLEVGWCFPLVVTRY